MGKITFAFKAIYSTKDWEYLSAVCDTFIIIFRITNYKIKRGHSITYTEKVNLGMTSCTKKNTEQKATPARTPYPIHIQFSATQKKHHFHIHILRVYRHIALCTWLHGATVPRRWRAFRRRAGVWHIAPSFAHSCRCTPVDWRSTQSPTPTRRLNSRARNSSVASKFHKNVANFSLWERRQPQQ